MNDPRLHLLLVGGDTGAGEPERLRLMASSHDFLNHLHLVGYSSEPQKFLRVADVVVNSRTDPEPFGLSVVEAMMMAKPLLVHALGGPAETVLDNQTGWHVPEPTLAAFQAGIERALADRPQWRKMGEAGRERALRFFSVPAQVDWYLGHVKQRMKPGKK
ncbi:MAG TPA: glycosyltransferase family 4 protein [Phycisphaerae bacterium]|nr:glycosyltransferase family 4 protein [Phycisphaerae bacterium]